MQSMIITKLLAAAIAVHYCRAGYFRWRKSSVPLQPAIVATYFAIYNYDQFK